MTFFKILILGCLKSFKIKPVMVIKGLRENTVVSISQLRKEGKGYTQASTLFGSFSFVMDDPVYGATHTLVPQRVTTNEKSKSRLTNGVGISSERNDQNV